MQKIKYALILFLLLSAAGLVSAWGNETYRYVCDEAVRYSWGSEALERCVYNQTLSFQRRFCDVILLYQGEQAYHLCMAESGLVHPSLMPLLFFNDPEYHRDYSDCPIRSEVDARYLCSSESENPSLERSLVWFEVAWDAGDECTRIYEFCIGSNYMADVYNPLSHLLYGIDQGSCSELLDKKVDTRILEPYSSAGWTVSQVCSFRYMQPLTGQSIAKRYAQEFRVSNKTFVDLLENLTFYAGGLAKASYLPEPTTSTTLETTTSTTTVVSTAASTTAYTVPSTEATVPSTTLAVEESGGVSCLPLLFVVIVLAAAAFFVFKNFQFQRAGLGRISGGGVDRRPRKHQIKSLNVDESHEDFLSPKGGGSHLRNAGVKDEEGLE